MLASGMASTRTPSSRAAAAVVGPMTATTAPASAAAPQRAHEGAQRGRAREGRGVEGGQRRQVGHGQRLRDRDDVDDAAARDEDVAQVLAPADGLREEHARPGRQVGERRREPLLALVVGRRHEVDAQAGVASAARAVSAPTAATRGRPARARARRVGARRREADGRRAREHDPVVRAAPASAASSAASSRAAARARSWGRARARRRARAARRRAAGACSRGRVTSTRQPRRARGSVAPRFDDTVARDFSSDARARVAAWLSSPAAARLQELGGPAARRRARAGRGGGPTRVDVVVDTGARKVTFRVELARTEPEHEKGLMYRDHLAPDAGMLFLFERPSCRRSG